MAQADRDKQVTRYNICTPLWVYHSNVLVGGTCDTQENYLEFAHIEWSTLRVIERYSAHAQGGA